MIITKIVEQLTISPVCISAEAPISAAPELLAHELAHVATPEDTEHGES